jgi:hypothetical protein
VRRYVTCDAKVRYQIEDQGRRLLGITPSAETVDTKTRAYIEDRDRGCRFPGCTARRWLHVHHIEHREDPYLLPSRQTRRVAGGTQAGRRQPSRSHDA